MNDDELIALLRVAFAPEPVEPPPDGLRSLRMAVNARAGRRQPHRRWAVPVFTATALAGMSGVALAAAGTPLPRVVRQVVHSIGLPVDSPQLVDARALRAALRAALDRGDLASVAVKGTRLRAGLEQLSADERRQLEPDADHLLQRADARLAAEQQQGPGQGPDSPGSSDNSANGGHDAGVGQPDQNGAQRNDGERQPPTTAPAAGGSRSTTPGTSDSSDGNR